MAQLNALFLLTPHLVLESSCNDISLGLLIVSLTLASKVLA